MKLMIRFMKPHWKLCVLTMLLLIIDVTGGLYIPTLAAQMMNQSVAGSSFDLLLHTGVKMAIGSVLAGACAVTGGYACATLTARIGKDMRVALYEKSLALSVHDFRQFGTASITTRTISDITNIQTAFISFMQMVVPVPVICIIALILAFRLDTQIGFVLLAAVLLILSIAYLIITSASPLFRRLQKLLDSMSSILLENITGVRVIRAFNNESREQKRLNESFFQYANTSIKANRKFANLDGLSFFCINFVIIAVYWLSGGRIAAGHFQIGDITAVIEYAFLILFFLMMAQMVILTLPRALECCDRIQEVLAFSPEISDPALALPADNTRSLKEVLTFRHVSFRFPDAEEDTLNSLSFTCRRGQTTAIIGGTGSGKSTIASMILRFHDVTEGAVILNNQDIRTISQRELRDRLSYVQQKAMLFSGTIAENLRYSNAEATDEELMHAADVAQVGNFIRSLPDGLHSFVAQGGTNFSGGQRQRLSIARALVKRPELYIFDDSFSALDFKTDAALRRALVSETQDAAVLIIAQRVSSIRHAQQIVVLDEGKLAGIGTHEELMESCPVYMEIYDSQTKEAQEV